MLTQDDLQRLAAWMDGEGLPRGEIEDFRALTGGTQNLVFVFRRGGRSYVLRRPPLNKRPHSDATMLREVRLLQALQGTDVPHTGFIAACEDQAVLGAVFYLMDYVEGFNVGNGLPAAHRASPALRHAMGLSMIEALVAIGRIDHRGPALEGFGRPEGFLQRQPQRWRAEFEGYPALWPGYSLDALPDIGPIGDWLERHMPPSFEPGVMHGDYHLANVIFEPDGARLAAVVDWEMATIGDPLCDLAWLLESWPSPTQTVLFESLQPRDGFTPVETLTAHYTALGGRSLAHLDWYRVLACYKAGVVIEGSYARACAGKMSKAVGDMQHRIALMLIQNALRRIGH